MKRQTYIYWFLPLFVFLSCGNTLAGLMGSGWALAVASPVIILAWAVVWLRLYYSRLLRPEAAVLAVLPHSIYFMARFMGTDFFTHAAGQNLYALAWLAFVFVAIASMRLSPADVQKRVKWSRDAVFILMCLVTVAYAMGAMASYASILFYL